MYQQMINWGFVVVFVAFAVAVNAQNAAIPQVNDPLFQTEIKQTISFTIPTINVDAFAMAKDNYLVLDARKREEYEVSHIPGAQFIGYRNWDKSVLTGVAKEQAIVVYCSIGYRSEKIGEQLKELGYTNVQNLYGSIFEWANQGCPLVDKEELPTNTIHTYNKQWSRWVKNKSIEKVW